MNQTLGPEQEPTAKVLSLPPNQRQNTIVPMKVAIKEAKGVLNDSQVLHLIAVLDPLKDFGEVHALLGLEPHLLGQRIWMLEETGGALGKKTVQVFFAYLDERREVVLLGVRAAWRPLNVTVYVIKMEQRFDHYLSLPRAEEPCLSGLIERGKDSK